MTTTATCASRSDWLAIPKPNPLATLRLFCFPYAGGGPQLFHPWAAALPHNIELVAVCMPGRGRRFLEPAFSNIEPLIEALASVLPTDKPFVFFGHSMGALIAYELACRISSSGCARPEHLIASACFAPHEPDPRPIHHLAELEFIAALKDLNGMPHEVLQNEELLQLVMPTLRADFTLTETYVHSEGVTLGCPLTVIGGDEDTFATRSNLEAWRRHTTSRFLIKMFKGDHFFLHASQSDLLQFLIELMSPIAARGV